MAFQYLDLRNDEISGQDVRWHLDHLFRVVIGVSSVLKTSNPQDYRININPGRSYVFINGKIPRGRGKAPDSVKPNDTLSDEDLMHQYILAKKIYTETQTLPAKCNFSHYVFGMMNLRQSRRFIRIHTQHHLEIINEIIISRT